VVVVVVGGSWYHTERHGEIGARGMKERKSRQKPNDCKTDNSGRLGSLYQSQSLAHTLSSSSSLLQLALSIEGNGFLGGVRKGRE
jgi:hypothetical protein